ncbi:IS66 family transposase [Cloacibacillus sp.]
MSAHRRLLYGRLGADIRRCGCWAHVRRKFHEGIQAVPQEEQLTCASQKGLEYCDRLFALERDYTKLTLEERRVKRLEQSKAITDALFAWGLPPCPSQIGPRKVTALCP